MTSVKRGAYYNEDYCYTVLMNDNNETIQPYKPPVKPLRRVTAKEKKYIANIASGMTKRDAIRNSYDVSATASVKTLDKMSANIEKREVVLALLNKHEQEAQETVIDVMRYSRKHGNSGTKDGAQYARVAVDGANSLLDRIHGKAKQSIDVTSKQVTINVDLSGE